MNKTMAKIAKDAMKVKTALKNYECKWSFKTAIETWDHATLVANIRAGIRYAIARKITLSVQADEQNMTRNSAILAFMKKNMAGDPESTAKITEFCKMQDIRSDVQTEFIFSEDDFRVVVEEDEPEE
jgi:Asp-tRNA(Asn)/Glu-tRNA(Gln) amidotransferase C subunit